MKSWFCLSVACGLLLALPACSKDEGAGGDDALSTLTLNVKGMT